MDMEFFNNFPYLKCKEFIGSTRLMEYKLNAFQWPCIIINIIFIVVILCMKFEKN